MASKLTDLEVAGYPLALVLERGESSLAIGSAVTADFFSFTIPADTLNVGDILRGRVYFTNATLSSAGYHIFQIDYGVTAVTTSSPVSQYSGASGYCDFSVRIVSATSARVNIHAVVTKGDSTTLPSYAVSVGNTVIDITSDQDFTVQCRLNASSGGTLTGEQYSLELLR